MAMTTLAARLLAVWWLFHSTATAEAAHTISGQAHGGHPDQGFGGYEEWSDTEIIILLSLAFACVVVFLIVGLALNRRTRQQRQRNPRKVITAADVEQHFPVSNTDEEPTCAVCLSTIEVDEPCRRTQCGHEFHADCIMQWWTHKPRKVLRCPICRRRQHVKHEKADPSCSDLKLQLPNSEDLEEGLEAPVQQQEELQQVTVPDQGEQPPAPEEEADSQEEQPLQPGQPEKREESAQRPPREPQPQPQQEQQRRPESRGYPQPPSVQQGTLAIAPKEADVAAPSVCPTEPEHPLEVCICVAKTAIETIASEDRTAKQEI